MSALARPSLDRRALGLALTRIANVTNAGALGIEGDAPAAQARRIGLTGAPGAGKSTLAGRLAVERLKRGRVGVLAIDPTSPLTGGAILGDRIRMDDVAGADDLYIRSFASRSAADGLTDNIPELLETMDRFGFDEVIVETVGVGQAELAVRTHVDTLIVVVPPDAGDVIQAMKAGILEVADIYAITKADMPAAARMATEIQRIVTLTRRETGAWVPPIVPTARSQPESITELACHVDRHGDWLRASGEYGSRCVARRKYRLRRWIERMTREIVDNEPAEFFDLPHDRQMAALLAQLANRPRA